MQIVGVDDPRPAEPDRGRDLRGPLAPAQQRAGRARPANRRRVAAQQLRLLAEMVLHEPHQILDGTLLATGGAVAVVQEEDHRRSNLDSLAVMRTEGAVKGDWTSPHCLGRAARMAAQ